MSGRIRTIKPELLTDERTSALSHEAWRLFVSLLLMADDHGNLPAAPRQIEGQVFWSRPSVAGIVATLDELAAAGLVVLYEVRGQRFAHLSGWAKHQRIDRPSKPRYPLPDDMEARILASVSRGTREGLASGERATSDATEVDDNTTETSTIASPSRDTRETLAPDLRSPISDPDHRGERAEARAEPPSSDVEQRPRSGPLPPSVIAFERRAWIAAYERAVDDVRGPDFERWAFPAKAFSALVSVAEKHCHGENRKAIDRWVERDVSEFVRAVLALNEDPRKLWSGFGPDGLQKWHNDGRPGMVREAPRFVPPPPLPPPPMTADEMARAATRALEALTGGACA
jgi:hypothetical protein